MPKGSETSNAQCLARLLKSECPDATYRPLENPLVFRRAKGSEIFDVEGQSYIDLCAGFGVLALGHNPCELQEIYASPEFIQHGMGDVYPADSKIELLHELLTRLPPRLNQGALALSGGQAVELALKTAMLATGRNGFIVFEGGYHGLDLGVLAATARPAFREPFAAWLAEQHIERLPFGCDSQAVIEAVDRLSSKGSGFAATIVEPIQGRAGVRIPHSGWLNDLATTAHDLGGLLILDEIFTGLGRLGHLTSATEIDCDIICLGKALGGGLPLSACVATASVMGSWPVSRGEALHTGTFFGHPLACRLGAQVIREIEAQSLSQRAARLGDRALDYLRANLKVEAVELRGRGLMIGVDLKHPGAGARLMDRLRGERVIALAGGDQGEVLSLSPALNIPENLLWRGLQTVCEQINCYADLHPS